MCSSNCAHWKIRFWVSLPTNKLCTLLPLTRSLPLPPILQTLPHNYFKERLSITLQQRFVYTTGRHESLVKSDVYRLSDSSNLIVIKRQPKTRPRKPENRTLRIVSWNARSVCNKSTQINEIVTSSDIDLFCITESWLSGEGQNGTVLYDLIPPGYELINSPRNSGNNGGGIAILYKTSLPIIPTPLPSEHYDSFEMSEISLQTLSRKLLILCLYRPPSSSKPTFLSDLESLLSSRIDANTEIIVPWRSQHSRQPRDNPFQSPTRDSRYI